MKKILKVHSVNDYARYIGAPVLHPHISVIHYDELEHCRHSLNSYDVYGIFIADQRMEALSYGQLRYDMPQHFSRVYKRHSAWHRARRIPGFLRLRALKTADSATRRGSATPWPRPLQFRSLPKFIRKTRPSCRFSSLFQKSLYFCTL